MTPATLASPFLQGSAVRATLRPSGALFATDSAALSAALGIVYRAIASHLVRKAGLNRATAQTGAVTLIQRFCSALNLNIHFHLLVLDGVYERQPGGVRFRAVAAPTSAELEALLRRITERIGRHLERRGLLVRDAENAWLEAAPGEDSVFEELLGNSITYRIAIGSQQGRKAFTLQTLAAPPLTAPAGAPLLAKRGGPTIQDAFRGPGKWCSAG
jgi:Putative transposase